MSIQSSQSERPQGWASTTVSEITKERLIGLDIPGRLQNLKTLGTPYIKMNNITKDGTLDLRELVFVEIDGEDLSRFSLLRGDILVNTRNSFELVGKTAIVKDDSVKIVFNNNILRIRVHEGIDPFFIAYQMNSPSFRNHIVKEKKATTNICALYAKDLLPSPLLLAPLNEQRRIVSKIEELFTKLDAGVEALKKSKIQLKQYRQCILNFAFSGKMTQEWRQENKQEIESSPVFLDRISEEVKTHTGNSILFGDSSADSGLQSGWVTISIGDVSELKNGINFTASQKGNRGILTLDVLNMYSKGGFLNLRNIYRVDTKPKEDHLLREGDILFVRSSVKREGVGWATLYKEIAEPMTFCGFIIRARLLTKLILPEYLIHFLRSSEARRKIINLSSQVTITNINQDSLRKIDFPLPQPIEQRQIVGEIDRLFSVSDDTLLTVERSLAYAERLRHTILKTAFEGKLVSQEPADEPVGILFQNIQKERTKTQLHNSNSNPKAKVEDVRQRRLI